MTLTAELTAFELNQKKNEEKHNEKRSECNDSTGLRIYCADRKKMIQECKNPITEGNFIRIFACNYEGTEQV